ncbi:MAG: carboxypeptidase-like regulatory domain-containing protein, partial [bacterium]
MTASAIVAAVGTLAPIALAAQAAAPTIKLSHLQGTVLDPLDNPLTKVIIEIDDPAMATFTDESGFFRLRNIPAGARTIRVKKIGFDGVDFELDLLADSTVHIGVKLQPVAQTLGTVTVLTKDEESHPALAATGFYAQKRAGFGTLFSPEEIEKKKESVNDASSMFRDVLGVTLRRERTGGANLQGKPSGGGSIQKGIQTVCMMNVLKDGMFMKINPGETFDQIVSKDEVYA